MGYNQAKVQVTIAQTATVSSGFQIPNWALFAGVFLPNMDPGPIGIEITMNGGSDWYPLLDPTDGNDVVICASGADPGWIDFSDFVRFVPNLSNVSVRFTCAAQNTAGVTLNVFFRG